MHKPATDPASAERVGRRSAHRRAWERQCGVLQCHESFRDRLSEHTHHADSSAGSSCYNCHMPYTTYGLLKTIRSHTVSSPSAKESVETGRPNACNLCHLDKTLAWTSEHSGAGTTPRGRRSATTSDRSRRRYSGSFAAMPGSARSRAGDGVATGTAGVGHGWMAPHLATLLDDPYDAVRFIAGRSLGRCRVWAAFPTISSRRKARYQAQLRTDGDVGSDAAGRSGGGAPELLLDSEGRLQVAEVLRILRSRDTRRVLLRE